MSGIKAYDSHPHKKKTKDQFKPDKLRILALQVDRGGCGWYRVRQWMKAFEQKKLAHTRILESSDKEEEIKFYVENADLIIARNGHAKMIKEVCRRVPDTKFVFDHDDNTFLIAPSNEHYKDHGTNDVFAKVQDKQVPLWVHGVTPGFDKYLNRERQLEMIYLLEQSNLNTAPTKLLASLWGEYNNGHDAVVPNCINFEAYPDIEVSAVRKKGEFRIGWQGGVSHIGDFKEVGPELAEYMKKDKTIEYYSIGAFWDNFFKGVIDRCHVHPWVEFQAHSYRMKAFNLDLAIIPLQDIPFNDYKSEIKFSEFAALKVPCLIKRRSPYVEVVEEGVTAIMYDNKKEFTAKLDRLVKDEELRKKLVKNAYEWVRENRDIDKWAPKIIDIYKKIADGKDTVRQALGKTQAKGRKEFGKSKSSSRSKGSGK